MFVILIHLGVGIYFFLIIFHLKLLLQKFVFPSIRLSMKNLLFSIIFFR